MVPMLTCGLVRWNFAFATVDLPFSGVSSSLRSWLVRLIRLRHSLRCSFARRLRDDFLGDVARNLGVGVELHRVARPSLRLGPEVADVAEHLRQRDERLDDPGSPAFVHGLDLATPRVEVTDHVAHVLLGRGDLDCHHRLEQYRVGPARGGLERHRTGDLERHLGRVDLVVAAVEQGQLHAHERVAGEDAVLHGFLRAGVDGWDELPRDASTGDRVDELVRRSVRAHLERLKLDLHLRVLARATGLLLVDVVLTLDDPADRLAVGHLRLADVRLDLELAAHAIDEDLQVELAHPLDDRLAGLLVVLDLERRVLFGELLDRGAQLLLVALRLRLDGNRDDRVWERHRLEHDRLLRIGQRVAGRRLLQTRDGDDVTGAGTWQLLTLVRVHLIDLADALLAALGRVEHLAAVVHDAGVDPQIGELAQVLVSGDLEGKRRERLGLVGAALGHGLAVEQQALDVIDIER